MTRVSARFVVLSALLVALTALPATAQSRWDTDVPLFLGLAENGLLITIAPPAFTGCTLSETWVTLPGMPHLDLWSVIAVTDDGAPVWNMRWVLNPRVLNILSENDARIRVFPVTAQDLEEFLATPCVFYGTRPFIADGLGRMNYHSADDSLTGPGVNSWGWTIQGNLTNSNGYCPAGRNPRLFWLQRWVGFSQTDITATKSTSSKGPTLTCK